MFPRHVRYHCATHRDRGSWEGRVHNSVNYIHEMAVMYIFLSFLSMTLLFLGGTYLRLGRLTVEPSAYALVAGRGNAPRSVRLMRPSGST